MSVVEAAPAPAPTRRIDPLLQVEGLKKYFGPGKALFSSRPRQVKAVEDVSFDVAAGEVVGLVGESGSGKTTVGRSILRLIEPTAGKVYFDGTDITRQTPPELRRSRKDMQIIFQDPYASLNPRLTVGQILGQALDIHAIAVGREREGRIVEMLERVGLSASHIKRYPHEFSGGQRQRVGIARSLSVGPRFVIADEPVSALDVSVQAQIVNLLQDLQRDLGLALLFIAHDLGVVEYISDRVIVMYLGRIMEVAPARELYTNPRHPYTEVLLSAIPVPDPTATRQSILLEGDIPSPMNPPSGCVFRTRCPIATAECAERVPPLEPVSAGHLKACIRR